MIPPVLARDRVSVHDGLRDRAGMEREPVRDHRLRLARLCGLLPCSDGSCGAAFRHRIERTPQVADHDGVRRYGGRACRHRDIRDTGRVIGWVKQFGLAAGQVLRAGATRSWRCVRSRVRHPMDPTSMPFARIETVRHSRRPMKFHYSIDIIGKHVIFEISFGLCPPQNAIRTKADKLKLLRIPACPDRSIL